ncbi:hypothetical protein BACI349Y_540078 [Bacillus sp. 349Y]|nr:hypothetical protein BACI349Y_540078 [Bacillus sp. 349Y]
MLIVHNFHLVCCLYPIKSHLTHEKIRKIVTFLNLFKLYQYWQEEDLLFELMVLGKLARGSS